MARKKEIPFLRKGPRGIIRGDKLNM